VSALLINQLFENDISKKLKINYSTAQKEICEHLAAHFNDF